MSRQSLRLLVIAFALFVVVGVASLRILGGSDGNYAHDIYKVLTLFPLNGSWVIQERIDNPVILIEAFIAPIFAIFGLIELFASELFRKLARALRLSRLEDHLVLVGLTEESLMLLDALRHENPNLKCVIIDKDVDTEFAQRARRRGAITLPGDASTPEILSSARLSFAAQAVFLRAGVTDALQFILAANATVANAALSKKPDNTKGIDLWVGLKDASMGVRLGEYFKFTGLSENLRTQFFSLDELAARQLLRAHPPDVYADAFGQENIHLALYGLNSVAIHVITETLRQCVTLCTNRVKFTVLADDDDDDDDLQVLYAAYPAIDEIADIEFRCVRVFPSGLAEADYASVPEDVTLHVVCYERAEKAASVALSLRRLLLVPPKKMEGVSRRLNAPILVRLARTSGIGELLRSNVDRMKVESARQIERSVSEREIPDGIYAFGTLEDLLSADKGRVFIPTLIDNRRENIAKRIHAIYMEERTVGRSSHEDPEALRRSEQVWASLAPEFRDSCRQSADHIFTKARVLRMRISAKKTDLPMDADDDATSNPDNVKRLALVEHHRWMNERFLAGWIFDEKRVDAARRHNLLKPWAELPDKDTRLDYRVVHRMRDALSAANLVAKSAFVIGVVGHRSNAQRPFDPSYVRKALRARFIKELATHRNSEPMLLTSLAPGTDIIAAELALELDIPFTVPLPLPFEALIEDFEQDREQLNRFLRLIARSERYIELPLRFGDLVSISQSDGQDDPLARQQQYALAGAYIAERADMLIAVWDGCESRGLGGTADIVSWRAQGAPPPEYRTSGRYYAQANIRPAAVISPTPPERIPALVE